MKNDLIQFAVMALALVLGGAAEEMLPNVLGVGFPVLLAAAQYFAVKGGDAVRAMLFACAAGALEDALSSLPAFAAIGCFLIIAAVGRWTRLPQGTLVLTYPVFQVWLYLFEAEGGIFNRILLALPIGLVTELAVWRLIGWLERKAAVDGRT